MAEQRASKRRVLVFNRDTESYDQEWKGIDVVIRAGRGVEMSYRDAQDFMGTYSGQDPLDPLVPRTKNLVIKEISGNEGLIDNKIGNKSTESIKYISNYDGIEFSSEKELNKHLDTIREKTIAPELNGPMDLITCQFCGKKGIKGAHGFKRHLTLCPALLKGQAGDPAPTEELDITDIIGEAA